MRTWSICASARSRSGPSSARRGCCQCVTLNRRAIAAVGAGIPPRANFAGALAQRPGRQGGVACFLEAQGAPRCLQAKLQRRATGPNGREFFALDLVEPIGQEEREKGELGIRHLDTTAPPFAHGRRRNAEQGCELPRRHHGFLEPPKHGTGFLHGGSVDPIIGHYHPREAKFPLKHDLSTPPQTRYKQVFVAHIKKFHNM